MHVYINTNENENAYKTYVTCIYICKYFYPTRFK